jgi:hypothetical protein
MFTRYAHGFRSDIKLSDVCYLNMNAWQTNKSIHILGYQEYLLAWIIIWITGDLIRENDPGLGCSYIAFYFFHMHLLLISMIIFSGNIREIICPQESRFALQILAQSMLFQKENCYLFVHLI